MSALKFTDSELVLLLASIVCGELWYADFPDIVEDLRELKKKMYDVWCAEASKTSAEKKRRVLNDGKRCL